MKTFALTFPYNDCSAHLPYIEHFSYQTADPKGSSPLFLPPCSGLRFFYFNRGFFELKINGQARTMLPGDCLVVCPWENMELFPSKIKKSSFFHLIVRTKYFDEIRKLELGDWTKICKQTQEEIGEEFKKYRQFKLNKGDFLASLFSQLTNEIFVYEPNQNEMVVHLIDQILILFAREVNRSKDQEIPPASTIYKSLESQITKDLMRHWTVADLARLVQLSSHQLSNQLKLETGLSPIHFLIHVRIERAKQLLQIQEYKIGDIAFETGFYSPQHFSLTFKKIIGMSPQKYRKSMAYEK